MVEQDCESTKCYWMFTLDADFRLCEFYLNKKIFFPKKIYVFVSSLGLITRVYQSTFLHFFSGLLFFSGPTPTPKSTQNQSHNDLPKSISCLLLHTKPPANLVLASFLLTWHRLREDLNWEIVSIKLACRQVYRGIFKVVDLDGHSPRWALPPLGRWSWNIDEKLSMSPRASQ